MRLEKLPGWAVNDDASVRDEVADYVRASPSQLWDMTRRCARSATWALRFQADPSVAIEHRDPLPESTRAALERLRIR